MQQKAISSVTKETTDREERGAAEGWWRNGKTRDEKIATWREMDFMDYLAIHPIRPPTHRDYYTHIDSSS